MKHAVASLANRMSLRAPQRVSLDLLDGVCDLIELRKGADPAAALAALQQSSEFPLPIESFERDFPSLCFALATGVGKTRLMGAFVTYLYQQHGIRHFFVLAPNLTIYEKLIKDFTPNTPKYVFQGVAEFAGNPPEIITGDNYESGRGVRDSASVQGRFFDTGEAHINIFNISKINTEVRGGASPRIKRLSEYIGESYFEYLANLPDLVLLMDESHRYRASAGVRAINELKPILGLELTATPFIEKASSQEPFKNVLYSYPLANAINDGFVKEPAVATRENFDPRQQNEESLEAIKLEDGIHIHEQTKVQLDIYARNHDRKPVKPFMLVVAKDTTHADKLKVHLSSDDFFEGRYRDKVITVHSNTSGAERDETIQQLLTVEDPQNPTEIVIHVNMLKEGWDVTNLYTIVPLRAANARTLVEQSIGRGLRLPYGQRTGVRDVDRLTIVAHDKFQEIVDEANRGDSIIRATVIVGKDIAKERKDVVDLKPSILGPAPASAASPDLASGEPALAASAQKPLFRTAEEHRVAEAAVSAIAGFQKLSRSADLQKPEIRAQLVQKVRESIAPAQGQIEGTAPEVDVDAVVEKAIDCYINRTIDIPRIVLVPKGEIHAGFRDFDLDTQAINYQPVESDILIKHLRDNSIHRLEATQTTGTEERLENYVVRGLIDKDDIDYREHARLLYKLAGQVVNRLRANLGGDDTKVLNVLQYREKQLVAFVYAQMQAHFEERATEYEITVTKGFEELRTNPVTIAPGEKPRPFRAPVDEAQLIRGMVFDGFHKCVYDLQKFDTDTERRFAILLEDADEVQKWFKPAYGQVRIYHSQENLYVPDFIVETDHGRYLCETKRAQDMQDEDVQAKAKAANQWCQNATKVTDKQWHYLLIPHDAATANASFAALAQQYRERS